MNESIGAKLKQAREMRHLTLQQVSETTKIRPHYLQALENDDLSAISSVAQARGFLRIYTEFLGLTPADLVPVAVPAVSAPPTQPSVSSTDHSTTTSPGIANIDKPSRPGFLTNLLNRFTRPADKETVSIQTTEPAPPFEAPKIPEPEPYVPARVTEELPENKVPVVVTQTPEIKSEAPEQIPIKDRPKTKAAKKVPSKPQKSSTYVDEQKDVKKKAGG
jgi:cytoskeleton protein RodZ